MSRIVQGPMFRRMNGQILKDWLTRKEAAKHLSSLGYIISCSALANLASEGMGPAYRKAHGRSGRTVYSRAVLEEWATRTFRDITPTPKKTRLIQAA